MAPRLTLAAAALALLALGSASALTTSGGKADVSV